MSNEADTKNARLEVLPSPSASSKADIWLQEHELQAFRRARKVRPEYAFAPLFLIAVFVMLEHISIGPGNFMFWKALSFVMFTWVMAMVGIPLVYGFSAFSRLEKGDPTGALRICDKSAKIVRHLGPMANFYQSFFTDQVRAVCHAMRGQLVEGQVLLAQWVYSQDNMLEDPLMQTTFGALYSYAGRADLAESVYKKRYETSKAAYASRLGKSIAAANMGWVKFLTCEYEESKKYSNEALNYICRGSSEDWTYVKVGVLINIARSSIRLGQMDESEAYITEARNLFNKQTNHPGTRAAEINLTFAELRLAQGRLDEALLFISSATECYRSTLAPGNAAVVYAMRVKSEILRGLGQHEDAQKNTAQAELDEIALNEDNENSLDQLRIKLLSGPNALLLPAS